MDEDIKKTENTQAPVELTDEQVEDAAGGLFSPQTFMENLLGVKICDLCGGPYPKSQAYCTKCYRACTRCGKIFHYKEPADTMCHDCDTSGSLCGASITPLSHPANR